MNKYNNHIFDYYVSHIDRIIYVSMDFNSSIRVMEDE